MPCRKLYVSTLFLLLSNSLFAATFVVTSNADSGQGTLRDALTQAAANGSAEKDYINFNLPDMSETGRTIIISKELPFISSNLVIDGTTQPGVAFGVSDAKIIIQPSSPTDSFNLFNLSYIDGFELYGLYIRDFYNPISYPPDYDIVNYTAVLYIEASKNIQLGAPGKGNVFANDGYITRTAQISLKDNISNVVSGVENLKVYSNFCGFEPDGKTYRGTIKYLESGLMVTGCKGNIEIGGDTPAQGNIFGNGARYIFAITDNPMQDFPAVFNIKNNYFDYDIDGSPSPVIDVNSSQLIAIYIVRIPPTIPPYVYPYSLNIVNNKIQYPLQISIGPVKGDIELKGNKLLYEPSTFNQLVYDHIPGIGLRSQGNVVVGGEQPGEANILYGSPLELNSPTSILIHHNSIYCVAIPDEQNVWHTDIPFDTRLPKIAINNITTMSASGTATPLSKVELFEDDDCPHCQPLTYFATVMADINGNWSYSGPISKAIISSATLNGFTSLFTSIGIINTVTVENSCGNNGSVTAVDLTNSGGYYITDQNNNLLSTNSTAKDLAPGLYFVHTNNGACSIKQGYKVLDASPVINGSRIIVTNPGCGSANGSITKVAIANSDVIAADPQAYTKKWIDASGTTVATTLNLTNVPAGVYTLEVSYKDQCAVTYGPVTLTNTTGPNIDQSQQRIQNGPCGQSTGSIKNIQVSNITGTARYIWWNGQQKDVSETIDLINQPAGTYKLQVTDGSQCGPVYSADITIPETNGITLDETAAKSTPITCGNTNGSVTGIKATGADTYTWTDANNKTYITATPDLTNVPAGIYTLTASNAFCSKPGVAYTVLQPAATKYPVYVVTLKQPCFDLSNGSVSVATDALVSSARWVDAQGNNASFTTNLTNASAGNYTLYLTDQNHCESLYNSYTLNAYPEFTVTSTGDVTQATCGLKNGGINNVVIAGGVPPYNYQWTDVNGKQIGTGTSISNLPAGNYTVEVTDGGCGLVDITETILDSNVDIAAPSVSNIQLCSSGSALLTVNNPISSVTYRLYDSADSPQPLDEQTGGRFKVNVTVNRSYYISQVNGLCESARSQLQVTVGLSTLNIANTFTPNADGVNDLWEISGIENYPASMVQLFNRYGQKVFESKGYSKPFDGKMNGKELPVGTYYYIINLSTNCSLLSGSLTIIR